MCPVPRVPVGHAHTAVFLASRRCATAAAPRGLRAPCPVHEARQVLALAQLVDGTHRVDGGVQGAPRVEVLLDRGQQVGALVAAVPAAVADDERVLQGLVRRHAPRRVDGQAALDKVLGRVRDAAPVVDGGEAVVGVEDGLHLLKVAVAVEGGVAAQQKVRDDAQGPNVDGLAVARLLEDLGGHVAGGAARRRQHVELFLVHDAGQAKVGDEEVGVVFGGAEQQVFGLEVAVDDAVVVEVGDGGEGGAHQVGSVCLVVATLAADAVEELAAEGEVGDEVQVVHGLEVVDERQDVLVAHRDLFQDGDFVADLDEPASQLS